MFGPQQKLCETHHFPETAVQFFSGSYLTQLLKCSAEQQSDSSYLEDDLV